jgi:hypothetical protein
MGPAELRLLAVYLSLEQPSMQEHVWLRSRVLSALQGPDDVRLKWCPSLSPLRLPVASPVVG